MLLLYLFMWWAPLRPLIIVTSRRQDIPFGINGPLEWMARWWLSMDAPTLFQPVALLAAWFLTYKRIHIIKAAWARSTRSAARRGAKWATYSWIPLSGLLISGTAAFLGHITPLAISTLIWLPLGVVFYIYGPRVVRALHTPCLLLVAATAMPDTIPELTQKFAQRIFGAIAVQFGRMLGDSMTFDPGSPFNVADDYLRSGGLNAPIAAPMNGLSLTTCTILIAASMVLYHRRGVASTAIAKLISLAVSGTFVLLHTLLIVITLHNGQKGYTVASQHNVLLLPITVTLTMVILKKIFASSVGSRLRAIDRKMVLWFTGLPDMRRRRPYQRGVIPQKVSKPVPPLLGTMFRMLLSPFRIYWRWLTRIDTKISKWESSVSRTKRPRR